MAKITMSRSELDGPTLAGSRCLSRAPQPDHCMPLIIVNWRGSSGINCGSDQWWSDGVCVEGSALCVRSIVDTVHLCLLVGHSGV